MQIPCFFFWFPGQAELIVFLNLQEAIQCVDELDLGSQQHMFVRIGVESTLERSQITRDHMGQLFFQLVQQGILPKHHFYKGSVNCFYSHTDL